MTVNLNVLKIICALLVLVLIAVSITACAPDGTVTQTNISEKDVNTVFTKIGNAPSYGLFRVEDKEKDIICWLYIGTENSAISCMPNHEIIP